MTKSKLFELDIDVEKLLKKVADSKKNIEKLQAEVKKFSMGIKENQQLIKDYSIQMNSSSKALTNLENIYSKLTEEQKASENIGGKLLNQIEQQKKKYSEASSMVDNLAKSQENYRAKLELTNSELRKQQADYRLAGRVVDDYNKVKDKEIGIISQTDGSITQLNRALSVNKKAYADLTKEERENEAVGGRLKKLINEQDAQYKELHKSIGNNQVEVGNYRQQLEGMMVDLKNGIPVTQVLTNGFKALYAQMLAIGTNPIGAALIALAGVAQLTKMWFDYNVEMSKSTRLVQQFTDLSGEALSSLTVKIRSLAKESGESEKAVINSVNATAEAYGLSYDEAFDKVQKGYLRVGDAADDYFDNTSEYVTHFKNMGYTADEFFSIMEAGAEGGAYKDKLIDTVKEFSLRFNDLPKSAREALNETFGNQFTSNLISQYEKGEIKGREVLERLITQGDKLGLTYEDTGALVANVMGAMGEDAGGYEKVVQAINKGLSETDRELSEIEKARQIELESTQALEEKWAQLFDQSGGTFEMLKAQGMAWINNVLIKLIDGVINFSNAFIETYNNSLMLRAMIGSIGNSMSITVNVAMTALKLFWNGLKSTGKLISSILTFDVDGVKSALTEGWAGAADIVKNSANSIANDIKKTIDTVKNGQLNKIEFDTSSLKVSTGPEETKKGTGKVGAEESEKDKKAREKAAKEAEKERQKQIDALIKLSEIELKIYLQDNQNINNSLAKKLEILKGAYDREKDILKAKLTAGKISQSEYYLESNKLDADYLENKSKITTENLTKELDLYIAQNRSKIDNDKALTTELVQAEQDRQEEIYTKRLQILEQQKNGELISEQDFLIEKLNLQAEYLENQKTLETSFKEQKKEADALDLENKRILEEEIFAYDLDRQLLHLEAKRKLEIEAAEKIGADTSLIEKKYANEKIEIERSVQFAKLDAYAKTAGLIRTLVGQQSAIGKAAAIAEIVATTWKNATAAFAQAAVFASNPLTAPLAVNAKIQGGLIIANGAANTARVLATKTKFQDGGMIKGNSHANGGVPFTVAGNGGFEAEGGEFIVNKKSTASYIHLLEAINQSSGLRKPQPSAKFINGGIVTSKMAANASLSNVNIDIDSMAQKIGNQVGGHLTDAVSNLPRPIVAVEDINTGQKNLADVVNGANL